MRKDQGTIARFCVFDCVCSKFALSACSGQVFEILHASVVCAFGVRPENGEMAFAHAFENFLVRCSKFSPFQAGVCVSPKVSVQFDCSFAMDSSILAQIADLRAGTRMQGGLPSAPASSSVALPSLQPQLQLTAMSPLIARANRKASSGCSLRTELLL